MSLVKAYNLGWIRRVFPLDSHKVIERRLISVHRESTDVRVISEYCLVVYFEKCQGRFMLKEGFLYYGRKQEDNRFDD